jgi:uncharacterized membrane protein
MFDAIAPHLLDLCCLLVSILLFSLYNLFVWRKLRKDPIYTIHGAANLTRTAWVVSVMEEKKDILAVQTLRNSTMAATFLASTAVLLAVGVLTLSGQSEKLSGAWHAVNLFGSRASSTLTLKLLAMLANLFIAFFSFSLSIRLYNHVGFMINAPCQEGHYGASFTFVAMQLNKAANYFHLGMRAYYFMIPLVFWLFGPLLMLPVTVIVIGIVFVIERTPVMDSGYIASFYQRDCADQCQRLAR